MTVYDYSFARPSLDDLVKGEGVIRYACNGHQNGKRLEQEEFDAIVARGIPIGHVCENSADPSTWDGAEAWRQHLALIENYPGAENVWPLIFADDQWTDPAHYEWVGQLLDATVVPLELRGIYGGAPHVQWQIDNGHATWGWITNALGWSRDANGHMPANYDEAAAMAPSACMQQFYNMSDIDGTDANRILKTPSFLWTPQSVDPVPNTPTSPEEDDMPGPMQEAHEAGEFVMRLYTQVAKRTPETIDAGGFDYWLQALLANPTAENAAAVEHNFAGAVFAAAAGK